jgi:transcriptional regulator with XRE-family HTH domain
MSSNLYLKNLKKYRTEKGWSQEKLSREAGISYQTVIKIERGNIENPKIETILKLGKALKISLDKLVNN